MLMPGSCVVALLLVLLHPCPAEGRQAAQPGPPREGGALEQVLLGETATDGPLGAILVSPNKSRVSWAEIRSRKWIVRVDGEQHGGGYNDLGTLYFSGDNRHVAFSAKRDKWVVLLDGRQQGGEYEKIRTLRFSPDYQHLAFSAARDKNKWVLVVDGQERPTEFYDLVGPAYSKEGGLAYGMCRAKKTCSLVLNGKEHGLVFDDIYPPFFLADGARAGFAGQRGEEYRWVIDGREYPGFTVLGSPVFSADGKRFAYGGAQVAKGITGIKQGRLVGRVVIDGQESPAYEGGVGVGAGFFSSTTAAAGPNSRLLCETHGVSNPVFSPDGKHVAYAVRRGKHDAVMMFDGQAGPQFEEIASDAAFSPDGAHLAYVVVRDGKYATVLDGKVVGESGVSPNTFSARVVPVEELAFSPDGRHFAYALVRGGANFYLGYTAQAKRWVFVNGREGKAYDARWLGNLLFSPDSRHLAYEVHKEDNRRSFVVVDGQEGKVYDDLATGSLSFTGNSTISYVAREGRKIYRVTQSVP